MTELNTYQSLRNNQSPKTITKANNVLSNHRFDFVSKSKMPYKNNNEGITVENRRPPVHYDNDKALRTTPWIEVVSKKKRRPDTFESEYIRSGTVMNKQK
jgi:hypothetical protein